MLKKLLAWADEPKSVTLKGARLTVLGMLAVAIIEVLAQGCFQVFRSSGSVAQVNNALFQMVVNNPASNPASLRTKTNVETTEPNQNPQKFLKEEPLVVVADPSVRITHWHSGDTVYGEKIGPGTVTAAFKLALVNVGSATANQVRTEWQIDDRGNKITSPDDWQRTIGREPWSPEDLRPGASLAFQYGPEIGASGIGTLQLTVTVSYLNPITTKPVSFKYRGFVDYSVPNEGDSKAYLLSPLRVDGTGD